MPSKSCEKENYEKILLTLNSISDTIYNLIEWNQRINSAADYYSSQNGMQLLAANCTLITAIGEGVNRINRISPEFLASNFPDVPWIDIVGMRNRIAHGYFELDADLVFETVRNDIPVLSRTIHKAINLCMDCSA